MLNILDFGAVPDGSTDNTACIQAALDEGGKRRSTVFVPDGHYLTSTLRIPSHSGLVGNPAWGFRDHGGSILELNDPTAECLIDISQTTGPTLVGLSLSGKLLGEEIHGVALNHEEFAGYGGETTARIESCRIDSFTGHGVYLNRAWCFSIRHCMITNNRGDGIWLRGWDGFILDNWLTGNGRAGFGAYEENASVTVTANRFEWNHGAGIEIHGGDHYSITGNFFDRHGGPGIDLTDRRGVAASQISVVGNILYRNGKPERCGNQPYDSSHLRCRNVTGIVISGNVCEAARDDPNSNSSDGYSPEWGIVIGELENAIIKDNVLHQGYLKQLLVDLGNHRGEVIVKDNIGSRHVG